MDCKGAVEDWDDPDEEVVDPVAPISAGSTALMLMLIGCTGSLVVDDDAACVDSSRLSFNHGESMSVFSIRFTVVLDDAPDTKVINPVPDFCVSQNQDK